MNTTSANQHRIALAYMRLLAAILKAELVLAIFAGQPVAEVGDRKRHRCKRESRNYIIRRQEAYQVEGVPTERLIIGRREIDIYHNGMMFEGDHLVGVKPR
jgi:hypothetical protein